MSKLGRTLSSRAPLELERWLFYSHEHHYDDILYFLRLMALICFFRLRGWVWFVFVFGCSVVPVARNYQSASRRGDVHHCLNRQRSRLFPFHIPSFRIPHPSTFIHVPHPFTFRLPTRLPPPVGEYQRNNTTFLCRYRARRRDGYRVGIKNIKQQKEEEKLARL